MPRSLFDLSSTVVSKGSVAVASFLVCMASLFVWVFSEETIKLFGPQSVNIINLLRVPAMYVFLLSLVLTIVFGILSLKSN